ncbi:MAG: glycosyltransferase family A protein [Actinomycetota bacterium]|nr:glycosyltransferase family A protein [Actinomycetota bacterium]
MNITVVIPALNAAGTLPAQLAALGRQIGAAAFHVVVVDNGSSDGTAGVAERFAAPFSLSVVHEPVRGINSARNAGVAAAGEGLVLLCDADDEVHPQWVAAMAAAIAPFTWVGGRLDYEALNSPATRQVWGAATTSTYKERTPFVDTTYGCNCGFWRSMWSQLGGFDTNISGTGGDETEFFMRAHAAGYRRTDVPDAVVSYRLRPGRRAMVRQRYRQGRNQVLMRQLPGGALLPGAETVRGALRALAKLILVSPMYAVSRRGRSAWAAAVARNAGKLAGLWNARRSRARPTPV